jgi:hypothetical protein
MLGSNQRAFVPDVGGVGVVFFWKEAVDSLIIDGCQVMRVPENCLEK